MGWLRDVADGAGGLALSLGIRSWMSTLRYSGAYFDPTLDPVHPAYSGPAIYLFWHEYISFLFYLRGHCDVAMLLSQHRDAEFLARSARQMGFQTVRGSSTRGGSTALLRMLKQHRGLSLTLTPDGPQGPRRTLAPGCVFLSSRSQLPLVPIGLAYDRPWRLRKAWDHHAVPRPFSRACFIFGPRLQIPIDADREALEHYVQVVTNWLHWLNDAADRWAAGESQVVPAFGVRRESANM